MTKRVVICGMIASRGGGSRYGSNNEPHFRDAYLKFE